jgi:hypothetical protein
MADDTPAAPAPASPPAPSLESRIETAIRAWRDEVIAGGPIARVTECWNHLEQSLQSLTAAIIKEL